jgi:DNA-binding PadR family transcriptional regulator
MHKVMTERGKNSAVNLPTRSSLYQLLSRLVRAELIAAAAIEKDGAHPDRTVYALTDRGRETAVAWLLEYLAAGDSERAGFIAALSSIVMVAPGDALDSLRRRRGALAAASSAVAEEIAVGERLGLPRLFQLDEHYRAQSLARDIEWLDELIGDLASGRLDWNEESIAAVAERMGAGGGSQPPAAGGVSRDSRSSST